MLSNHKIIKMILIKFKMLNIKFNKKFLSKKLKKQFQNLKILIKLNNFYIKNLINCKILI